MKTELGKISFQPQGKVFLTERLTKEEKEIPFEFFEVILKNSSYQNRLWCFENWLKSFGDLVVVENTFYKKIHLHLGHKQIFQEFHVSHIEEIFSNDNKFFALLQYFKTEIEKPLENTVV